MRRRVLLQLPPPAKRAIRLRAVPLRIVSVRPSATPVRPSGQSDIRTDGHWLHVAVTYNIRWWGGQIRM